MVTVETGPPGIPPLAGIVSLGPVVSWQVVPSRTNACSTGARSMRLPANSYPVRHWAAPGRGAAGGAFHPGGVGVTPLAYMSYLTYLGCADGAGGEAPRLASRPDQDASLLPGGAN